MADFKKMYLKLTTVISNSIEEMKKAMLETEEMYISEDDMIIDIMSFSTFDNGKNDDESLPL